MMFGPPASGILRTAARLLGSSTSSAPIPRAGVFSSLSSASFSSSAADSPPSSSSAAAAPPALPPRLARRRRARR